MKILVRTILFMILLSTGYAHGAEPVPGKGDVITLTESRWVDVLNHGGVRNGNSEFRNGDSCVIDAGEAVTVIDVSPTDGSVTALYLRSGEAYGTICPDLTAFVYLNGNGTKKEPRISTLREKDLKKLIAVRDALTIPLAIVMSICMLAVGWMARKDGVPVPQHVAPKRLEERLNETAALVRDAARRAAAADQDALAHIEQHATLVRERLAQLGARDTDEARREYERLVAELVGLKPTMTVEEIDRLLTEPPTTS